MKKALSIILALVMIVSMTPMAFALTASEKEAYVESYLKSMIYTTNVYYPAEANLSIPQLYIDGFEEAGCDVIPCDKYYLENFADKIPASKAVLDKANQKAEALIASGDVKVIINTSKYLVDYYHIFSTYDIGVISEYFGIIDEEISAKIDIVSNDIEAYLEKGYANPLSVNQDAFDNLARDFYWFYSTARNCLAGTHTALTYTNSGYGYHEADCVLCTSPINEAHTWGAYTPDNQGSKIASCTKCDATDSILDEDYRHPDVSEEVEVDFFTNIINTIKDFFNSIAEFFRNLFK